MSGSSLSTSGPGGNVPRRHPPPGPPPRAFPPKPPPQAPSISEPAPTSRPLTHPPPVSTVVGDHEAGRDSARPGPALLLRVAASIDGHPELLAGTPVTPPPSDPLPLLSPLNSGDEQSPVRVGVATKAACGGLFQAPVDGPHALAGAPPASGLLSGLPSTTSGTLAHGFEWQDKAVPQPIGGPVPRRPWSVHTQGGGIISEGGDYVGFGRTRAPLDYFLAVFPQVQLSLMTSLTSAKLVGRGLPSTSPGEILKFFGVLILATRFEFGSPADLWATEPRSEHVEAQWG